MSRFRVQAMRYRDGYIGAQLEVSCVKGKTADRLSKPHRCAEKQAILAAGAVRCGTRVSKATSLS
jgi:hypothetical protein